MNISPWEIYFVLQLDSIIGAAVAVLICCGVVALALVVASPIILDESSDPKSFAMKAGKRMLMFAAPALLVATFVPSSKTAAAMIVLPAIANNVAIQKEAGDLYSMAKDALREAVKPSSEK